MNVNLKKGVFILTALMVNTSYLAQDHQHAHEKIGDLEKDYFKGMEKFESKGAYRIILEYEHSKSESAQQEILSREKGNQFTTMSKTGSEKNNIYFVLADMLPAGALFRIDAAHNTPGGNLEVIIESREPIDIRSLETNPAVISAGAVDKDVHVIKFVSAKDDSIKVLNIPSAWSKEKGYRKIIRELKSGKSVVKISIVFRNLPDRSSGYFSQPYRQVVLGLMYDLRGKGYGYAVNKEKNQAWWTQEIDFEQAESL